MSSTTGTQTDRDESLQERVERHRDDFEAHADAGYSSSWIAEAILTYVDGGDPSDVTR